MPNARQILATLVEEAPQRYKTFIRSANNFGEFSSARKRVVDTCLTQDEARRACAAYNAELTPAQKRRGARMEFVSE